jgi:hypothetical protein
MDGPVRLPQAHGTGSKMGRLGTTPVPGIPPEGLSEARDPCALRRVYREGSKSCRHPRTQGIQGCGVRDRSVGCGLIGIPPP